MPDPVAGRYRLEQLLGRGAMSEVWEATDLDLHRRVALKFLAPGADAARFEREARAVASLSHPNVTRLYDFGWTDQRAYMVLECLVESLEDGLRRQAPLPDDVTSRVAREVAAGLAHAHEHGVVHRDLKPANVLFDNEGRAKLADFGVARIAAAPGTLTDPGTLVGTSAYMSPEQAAGAPATPASDVYSFGVTLHRMATGKLPFESPSALELVRLHRDETPPPPSAFRADIPPQLAAVVTAAMAKEPRNRPQDGAALLALLTGGGAGAGTAATEIIAPPAGHGRRWLLIALLAVLALAGAAVAWAVTRPGDSTAPPTTHPPATHHPTTLATTAPPTTTQPPTTTAPTTTGRATTTTQPATTTTAPHTTTAAEPTPPTTTAPATTVPTTTTPATTVATTEPTTTAPTTTEQVTTAVTVPTITVP